MTLYLAALLSLPVDIGLAVAGSVLTPARAVLLAAVVLAALQWRSVRAALERVPRLIWIGWAAFLGAALVTAAMVPSTESWARYGSLVAEGVVVFALICWAAMAPGGLRALMIAVAVTMIVVAAAVLILAALGQHYDQILSGLAGTEHARENSPRFGLERQAGSFRGAAYFGIWLTAASAFLLPTLAGPRGRDRWLALAGWAVLLGAVVLTGSRQAMTAMFALPGVYFLIRGQRAIGVASLVAAGAVVAGVSYLPASATIANSTTLRIDAVGAATLAIREHLLFGWGLLKDMQVVSSITGRRNFVDDTYLSLGIEMGLVGLGAFALMIGSYLRAMWHGRHEPVALALGLAVVIVLGMGILVSFLQASQGYATFFVISALAVVAALKARGATTLKSEGSPDPAGATASAAA
jgi:hypothetical protein